MQEKLLHYQEVLAYAIDNNLPIGKIVIEKVIDVLEQARFEIDDLKEEIEVLKGDIEYYKNRP